VACLSAKQLYAYLEGELEGAEREAAEAHLASCAQCTEILEDRRHFIRAAETLPVIEVPHGFARRIIERIPSVEAESGIRARMKAPLLAWLAAAAAGLTALAATLTGIALLTGNSLSRLFLWSMQFLWNNVESAASLLAKSVKYAVLAFKIIQELIGQILEALKILASFISPEAQAIFIAAVILLMIAGAFFWGRKLSLEKNHEN
jgi:hypothetical protein